MSASTFERRASDLDARAERGQLRNHIRSQSHDQVATLTSLSTMGTAYDDELSASYASIRAQAGEDPSASGSGAQQSSYDRAEASPEASDDQSEGLQFSANRRQRAHKRTKGNPDTSPHTRATPLPPTYEHEGRQPDWPTLPFRPGSAPTLGNGRADDYSSTPAPAPSPAEERNARLGRGGQTEAPIGSRAATPMIRKKSGELVRSSLKPTRSEFGQTIGLGPAREVRAKSVPSTPTGPKYVHFDSQLEHGA